MAKSDIIGPTGDSYYSNQDIPVIASSISCQPYSAKWYRRTSEDSDPWVSVRHHGDAAGELMVYGGGGNSEHATILASSGGMQVFIRNVPSCSRSGITGDIGGKTIAFRNEIINYFYPE